MKYFALLIALLLALGLWFFLAQESHTIEPEHNASTTTSAVRPAAVMQPGVLTRSADIHPTPSPEPEESNATAPAEEEESIAPASMRGYVSDTSGKPLEGWQINLYHYRQQNRGRRLIANDTTSNTGEYSLQDLPPQTYEVILYHPKERISRSLKTELLLSPGESLVRNFLVPLGTGSIKGRVGMDQEIGNSLTVELFLYSSATPDELLAKDYGAINWEREKWDGWFDPDPGEESRIIRSTEGSFHFKRLPPDQYILRYVSGEVMQRALVIEELIEVKKGETVDLGLQVFREDDFLQATFGYIPEWADAYKKAMREAFAENERP